MLAAIERLPSKEAQVKFLHKHGFLMEAAKLMVAEGERVFVVCFSFVLFLESDAVSGIIYM